MKLLIVSLTSAMAAALASDARAEPASFESPQAAVDALVAALEARDRAALLAVFGPEAEDVVLTGESERDREIWTDFMRAYRQLNRVVPGDDGERATLYIGEDLWPFPALLLLAEDGSWSFDAEAAREEVLLRRVGTNELEVIDIMQAYVDVQARFRRTDYDEDGVLEFANAVLSTEGGRDGLYWPPTPGAPESPIGDFVARAAADGVAVDGVDTEAEPYFGYYYRVLLGQGDHAPGGAMSYLVNDLMLAGHAFLAFPSAYGETGVMTFMVGENGVIYEADLGEDTLERASAIELFDPGPDWTPVEER